MGYSERPGQGAETSVIEEIVRKDESIDGVDLPRDTAAGTAPQPPYRVG